MTVCVCRSVIVVVSIAGCSREGSRDGGLTWICIDEQEDAAAMDGGTLLGSVKLFQVSFGIFQVSQTGAPCCPEDAPTVQLGCSGFELYGWVLKNDHPIHEQLIKQGAHYDLGATEMWAPPIAPGMDIMLDG